MLAQYLEESRKENEIYYISKKMLAYEEKYSPLEKTCVALVWATRKLRHYMLAFKVLLIARMDPLKYLMESYVQDGKTAKWVLILSEFNIKYMTQKSVEGRAIANHLAHYSPKEVEEIQGDFPDKDIIGIGVLLISPKGTHIPFSDRLNFPATKYEACIMGLRATLGLGVKELKVYSDSALIISQIQNRWKIKEERLMPYHECLQKEASKFSKIQYQYVLRMHNQIVDTLTTMASMMDGTKEDEARSTVVEQKEEPAYCMSIEENEGMNGKGNWYSDTWF